MSTKSEATCGCQQVESPSPIGRKPRRRRRRERECHEIAGFLRRMSRALVVRAADGDLEALSALRATQRELDVALREAARALNSRGYSWSEIGRELGTSKQNVIKRFAVKGEEGA